MRRSNSSVVAAITMATCGVVLLARGGDIGRSAAISSPVGTGFTYQGQLKKDGVPVSHASPGDRITVSSIAQVELVPCDKVSVAWHYMCSGTLLSLALIPYALPIKELRFDAFHGLAIVSRPLSTLLETVKCT